MYYTPGWGSIATTTVAVVALVATSIYNSRTLRAAASRFQSEVSERRQDKHDEAVVDVLHHYGQLRVVWRVLANENQNATTGGDSGEGARGRVSEYIRGDVLGIVGDLDRALIAA